MSHSVCNTRGGRDCKLVIFHVSIRMHVHTLSCSMPPLAVCMSPQLAAVLWVDYQQIALIPQTIGLGVVPTSEGTRNINRHSFHSVTCPSGSVEDINKRKSRVLLLNKAMGQMHVYSHPLQVKQAVYKVTL